MRRISLLLSFVLTFAFISARADAQSLGTFTWQMQPYCNRVSVAVVQIGSSYRLDGFDDQCGASPRLPVVGTATLNPDATVELGMTIVVATGVPVHVTAHITFPSASGPWTDSQGQIGAFVLGGRADGDPRPVPTTVVTDGSVTSAKLAAGAVGLASINTGEVQRRVTGVCPVGQLMTSVNEDGTVNCELPPAPGGTGDITAVIAGTGLTGGGDSGDVALAIASGGVTAPLLAPDSVDSTKIVAGSVGGSDVNAAEVQRRVTGTCTAGSAVRVVSQDGTVTCEPAGTGDVTGVTAGSGLSGGGVSGDVSLAIATGGVTGAMLAADSVDASKIGAGAVGTAEVNATEIQRRVTGACTAGSAVRVVNQDGTVSCEATSSTGDITAVTAGAGLTGGGTTGDVALAVSFAGPGAASSAARSDHNHDLSNSNTAAGASALGALSTGAGNTAFGTSALAANSSGANNTATGLNALSSSTLGWFNTAVGVSALQFNTTGADNTALGTFALHGSNGDGNTAVGKGTLPSNTTGSNNIAIGLDAGAVLESGSNNVYIQANAATAAEAGTLRIGSDITRAFIDGIRGVTTDVNDAIAVVIDTNGQLGTISSSRRTKDNIQDLGEVSRAIFDLRPVQFTYRQPFADGSAPVQYGLIAEEVAEVMPELVAHGKDGQIETVKYHILPTLLLAEVQRLERERAALAQDRDDLTARVAALERLVLSLTEHVVKQ